MNENKGYLQTVTCSISLSSCRVRAESLARALNSKLWSANTIGIVNDSRNSCDSYLTVDSGQNYAVKVIDKPPRTQMESFDVDLDKPSTGINHGWINELATEDGDDLYDTPPCSSPPSPADDCEGIIINPPTFNVTALPFCTKFLRNSKPEDVYTEGSKLRAKLQEYADGLLASADESLETFYDASEEHHSTKSNHNYNSSNCQFVDLDEIKTHETHCTQNEVDDTHSHASDKCKESANDKYHSSLPVNGEPNIFTSLLIDVQPASPLSKSAPDEIRNFDAVLLTEKVEDEEDKKGENKSRPDFLTIENRHLQKVKELDDEDRPKLLRTTSLKTGKTPPGTPGRKKIVRFADVLGLDLEAVRHIICDDLPHVPPSAFNDLKLPPENTIMPTFSSTSKNSIWSTTLSAIASGSPLTGLFPLFDTPGSDPNFRNRVRTDWVSLEKATVSDLSVHCVCCVLNVSYEKTVVARYTTDEWENFSEVVASYVPFASDGEFDRFSFSLFLQPSQKQAKQRLGFAIRYVTKGQVRWDNNKGQNYNLSFQGNEDNTTSMMLPTIEGGPSWLHHFY